MALISNINNIAYPPTNTNGTYVTTSNWLNPSTNFHSSNNKAILTIPHGEEKVVLDTAATLEVKGNIVMNGVDLDERLKTIEKVLAIPERDVILETKHPKLKELYDEYIHALAKYRTWETLKGNDND